MEPDSSTANSVPSSEDMLVKARRFHAMILEALQRVAAEPEMQIRSLPRFVHVPDEIALLYNDAFLLTDQVLTAGLLIRSDYADLKAIDDHFASFSGMKNAHLWTSEAIRSREEWRKPREMARQILKKWGVAAEPPSLDGAYYVAARRTNMPRLRAFIWRHFRRGKM